MFTSLKNALSRAKKPILIVAAFYLFSVTAGIIMVHSQNQFALSYRDKLVNQAQTGTVLTQNSDLKQGLADFGGNTLGGVADTALGMGIVFPFPLITYRGWVGGIVSVDYNHESRLTNPQEAAYYLSVLLLQLVGFTLAAGAGITAGLVVFKARPKDAGFWWFKLPKQALQDLLWIWVLVLPIFLTASLWEFLSPWR
jgi:uncharacterized membrane protein SpoIIM required for sporulation